MRCGYHILAAVLATVVAAGPAAAFQNQEEAARFYREFTSAVPDAVSWQTLANLDLDFVAHGPGRTEFKLTYPPALRQLDGTRVKMLGYIFPLEGGERHARFLLSAYPPGCPFCLPGGPRELVEVECDTPLAYSQEAILLEGTFHLLHDDPSGMFYRLTAAQALPR